MTSEFTVLNNNSFTNDIDGGISFWPEVVINDSLLVGFADAFDLIKSYNEHSTSDTKSAKLENVIKNLSETSNPVIMILTP